MMGRLRLSSDEAIRAVAEHAHQLVADHAKCVSIETQDPYLPRTAGGQFHVLTRCERPGGPALEKTISISRRGVPNADDLADRLARKVIRHWSRHPDSPIYERLA